MKNLLLITSLFLFFGVQNAIAQTKRSTYLYLEVDKDLPVKVKLNDEVIPNKRKGYIIVPKINDGTNTIEFDFDNPNFKTQKFTIAPEGKSSMGLKLMRTANNKFVIQDVVNKRIISDDNTLNNALVITKNNTRRIDPNIAKNERVNNVEKQLPQRGVVKVYEADNGYGKVKQDKKIRTKPFIRTKPNKEIARNERTVRKNQTYKKKQYTRKEVSSNVRKVQDQTNKTNTNQRPKRVYAMYRTRKPLDEAASSKRYKNYRKSRRAKRKAPNVKNKSPKVKKIKQQTPVTKAKDPNDERMRLAQERMAKKKMKESKRIDAARIKNAKKLQREQKLAEQEKLEALQLQQEKMLRKKNKERRLQKNVVAKAKSKNVEADIPKTKKVRLKKAAKPSVIKEKNERKKIINAEPISNNANNSNNSNNIGLSSPIRCSNVVPIETVANWTVSLHKKFDDEARMNYVNKNVGDNCISTNNLGIIIGNMDTQIGRYKMIRSIYPKIEDRSNVDRLYKYFRSKSYVKKIKALEANNY